MTGHEATAEQIAQYELEKSTHRLPDVLSAARVTRATFNTWMQRSKDPKSKDVPIVPELMSSITVPGHRKDRIVSGLGAIFIILAKRLVDGGATVGEALEAATKFSFMGEDGRMPGGLFKDEITMLVIERFEGQPSNSYIGALPRHWKGSGFFPPPQWHRGYAQGRPVSWLIFEVEDFLPAQCRELEIEPVETARDSDQGNLEIDKR